MDVVKPGEFVGVEEEGGGVEDELGGGPGQLLHLPVGEVEGVGVAHPRHRADETLLLRHLSHLKRRGCQETFSESNFFSSSCKKIEEKRMKIDID